MNKKILFFYRITLPTNFDDFEETGKFYDFSKIYKKFQYFLRNQTALI